MAESKKPTMRGVFINGVLNENPTFRLVLGTCPTLAVTTSAINGIGMGLAATFVLICSGAAISALRNVIPSKVRLPAYITIIAMPFAYSISEGICFGIISWTILNLCSKNWRKVSPLMIVLTILFLLKYAFL